MLTENDTQHTFKAPCFFFENAPNTDLLFFRQSMGVLIVGGIKYTISFWRKIYSIESKHNVLLCFLLKKKLCADKVISLCLFVYKLQDLKDSSLETFLVFPSCRNLNYYHYSNVFSYLTYSTFSGDLLERINDYAPLYNLFNFLFLDR